ncbi:DUF1870 family protein [Serratia sp. UGAL515B_01]|uniref:Aca2/YdiL-like domain-containing protein n=1 Tax=Serratia sp. UGAL515B_01 TaxID=2986763 RepID=UPI002953B9CA|nr:DUF1870 family protein [Serratia sp. UGAL515B_01]WON78055.1 YdiL family protein [Serratia sp. UGAL515B_01]
MNKNELKQLRRLLFLEVTEAAKLIGECEPRTWQRWEKGDRVIPNDVAQIVQMLALTRLERLQFAFNDTDPNYRYFETFEEYKAANGCGNELMWRVAQSVSASLICEREADKWRSEEIIHK